MIINVSEQNIREGKPSSSSYCPIANAVRDKVGVNVDVNYGSVRFPKSLKYRRRNLPPDVRNWIAKFDHDSDFRATCTPFSFTIRDLT